MYQEINQFVFYRGGASSLRMLVFLLVASFANGPTDRKTTLVRLSCRVLRRCTKSIFGIATATIFRCTLLLYCSANLLHENFTKICLLRGVLGEGRVGLYQLGIHFLVFLFETGLWLSHICFLGVAKRFNLMSSKTCDVSE